MMCVFSVFSDGCLWLFLWHVILIVLYFTIKWEWQIRWLLLVFWIRLGFHLQAFSHCHRYFLNLELQNQVCCFIMLLLLPSSLRWMLLHGVAIMAKSALFSLHKFWDIQMYTYYTIVYLNVNNHFVQILCHFYCVKILTTNLVYLYQFNCLIFVLLEEK